MNSIPGITIHYNTSAMASNDVRGKSIVQSIDNGSGGTVVNLSVFGWFEAILNTHNNFTQSVISNPGKVSVFLDGYISEIVGATEVSESFVNEIMNLYNREGMNFLLKIRGSYSCLIIDEVYEKAFFFTDRRGSRPVFYKVNNDDNVHISSEVSNLVTHDDNIDVTSIFEFLSFGSFYADHTLFSDVKNLEQASLLTFSEEAFSKERYWRLKFSPNEEQKSEEMLIEECNDLILQATKRILKQTEKPFLFLSGGTDSRIILGALLALNETIPMVSYGTKEGDDLSVAKMLANDSVLPFTKFALPDVPPVNAFIEASENSDCRAEMIDTPGMRDVYEKLSSEYSLFLNGDECFGWKNIVTTRKDAFDCVGMCELSRNYFLGQLLSKDRIKDVKFEFKKRLSKLYQDAEEKNANNLKDFLYYENRLGNMLNAFTGNKLRYFEQGRPLLDEDIMDFVACLPISMRDDKYLLRKVLDVKYPDLKKIPLSAKDSIPASSFFKKQMAKNELFSTFVYEQLIENLDDRLSSFINKVYLKQFIMSLIKGDSFTSISTRWWMKLPGMWRLSSVIYTNKIPPVTMMMRLLQINLYLKNMPKITS